MKRIRGFQWVLATCGLLTAFIPASVDAAEPKMTDAQLAEKARRLQKLVEERLVHAHGMIPMLVRASDYKLPTAEDYKGAYKHRKLINTSEAEVGLPPMHVWRAWENTSVDTALYLRAMAYQYCVSRDPAVLAICRRTFGALKYIYTLPIEKGERGFLCKPYGGQYSNQGGRDQLQTVIWGLLAYRPIAPPPDVADLDTMVRDFADFALKVPNVSPHGYFNLNAEEYRKQWRSDAWDRAISFLPLFYLAWQVTGDDRFATEIQRWYDDCAKGDKDFVNRYPTDKFGGNGFGMRRNLYLPSFLMEVNPSHRELWRRTMLSHYKRDRTGLLPDGTWPISWAYDSDSGKMTPKKSEDRYGRTGRSAHFAHACVSAQRWFPEVNMVGDARHILENLDEDTFRFVLPLDDNHPLPDEWVVESRMLDTDCVTGWLCAYWEGRYRGYWK